ncbi:MAG: hypothetical protein ACM3X0_00070 [Bacteroidota bacterium]
MNSHDEPNLLENAEEVVSPPMGRHDALALFLQLQRQGCFPYMLEERGGVYRVCQANRGS